MNSREELVSALVSQSNNSLERLASFALLSPTKLKWKVSNTMKLDPVTQDAAAKNLTEMVGSSIGVSLLAADDYEGTKAMLHKAIDEFPADMREALTPPQKTMLLQENIRSVRWHARELYRILGAIDHGDTPADDLTAPEDAPQTPSADGSPAPE